MKCVIIPLAACSLAACSPEIGPVVPETETERKMIGLLQKFDRWDDDGSGDLDMTELAAGLRSVNASSKPENVMSFYDTNRNERISLAEAQQGYQRSAEADTMIRQNRSGGAE